jgi:tetratricopeptide (TPR) repeat protein
VKQETADRPGLAGTYNNIGNVHLKQKNYELALVNFLSSLRIKKEIGDIAGISATHINMGNVYMDQQKFTESLIHFTEGLDAALKSGYKEWIKESHNGLSRLAEQRGDAKSAMLHYKLYIAYRDSLVNEENTKKTVQAQMQYDFDKQQAADSIKNTEHVKQEQLKHDQEIQQQRIYTYGGVLGFVLMLIVAAVSLNAYRQKKRTNVIIIEQKLLVEQKQKEVLDSIHYARRIQQSLFPTERYMERTLERLRPGK